MIHVQFIFEAEFLSSFEKSLDHYLQLYDMQVKRIPSVFFKTPPVFYLIIQYLKEVDPLNKSTILSKFLILAFTGKQFS